MEGKWSRLWQKHICLGQTSFNLQNQTNPGERWRSLIAVTLIIWQRCFCTSFTVTLWCFNIINRVLFSGHTGNRRVLINKLRHRPSEGVCTSNNVFQSTNMKVWKQHFISNSNPEQFLFFFLQFELHCAQSSRAQSDTWGWHVLYQYDLWHCRGNLEATPGSVFSMWCGNLKPALRTDFMMKEETHIQQINLHK